MTAYPRPGDRIIDAPRPGDFITRAGDRTQRAKDVAARREEREAKASDPKEQEKTAKAAAAGQRARLDGARNDALRSEPNQAVAFAF